MKYMKPLRILYMFTFSHLTTSVFTFHFYYKPSTNNISMLLLFILYIFFQNIQKTRAVDAIPWYDLKLSMILLLQLFIVPVILLWIYYFLKLSLLLFECIVETNNIQLGKIIIIELFEGIIIFVEGYYYNKNDQNIN